MILWKATKEVKIREASHKSNYLQLSHENNSQPAIAMTCQPAVSQKKARTIKYNSPTEHLLIKVIHEDIRRSGRLKPGKAPCTAAGEGAWAGDTAWALLPASLLSGTAALGGAGFSPVSSAKGSCNDASFLLKVLHVHAVTSDQIRHHEMRPEIYRPLLSSSSIA